MSKTEAGKTKGVGKKPADKQRLLDVRKEKKSSQPTFVRHAATRKKRLEEKWRSPRGLHNKLRLHWKSRGANVDTGYRSPALVRGLTRAGKIPLLVSTKRQLLTAEPETHDIILASGLGDRKRLLLIEEATKQGFTIINMDAQKRAAAIKAAVADRAKARSARSQRKSAREKELEAKAAKAEAKKAEETLLSDDEKRKQELQEQQKVLTSKEK